MGSRTNKQERKRSFKKHRGTGDVTRLNHRSTQAPHHHDKDSALQHLSAILGEFTLILDANGIIRGAWICNAQLSGQFHSKLIGQGIADLIGGSYYPILEATCFRVLASGQRECTEYVVEHPGRVRWYQSLVIPLNYLDDRYNQIGLLSRDITNRKQATERLRKSEALLQQAEELARMGSFELDLRTGAGTWSRQLYRNFQIDPQQPMTGKMFLDMVHPDDRDRLIREMDESVARKKILDSEFRCILPNGETRILHRRATPVYDDAGNPVSVMGMSQDITERKRFEDVLRNREALLAQAEELADLGSWEVDLETSEPAFWSDQRYRLLGLAPGTRPPNLEEFWQLLHPDDREHVKREFYRAITQARPLEYDARFILPDGRIRILHSRGIPVLDSKSRVIRMRGMAQDVTDRRREEERLRHSEALLAHAEKIANVGSWEYDVATAHVTLSRQLIRMYGLQSEQDWDLERYWKRVQAPDVFAIRTSVTTAIAECRSFEFTAAYRMPDGTEHVYHTVGKTVAGKDGSAEKVFGVVHDITAHTHAAENLRKLSQQLIRIRDNERRQLARGLHETAGQTLAALKMTLGNLAEFLPEDNVEAREQLNAARGFAEDAVREVRLVSYLMYPPLLDDAGLAPAVSWYVRGFSERSNIRATVAISEDLGRYSQDIESALFSVVQEALTNVHRYSGSPTAIVRLNRESDSIRAEIEDQGCGLPVMTPASGQPSGIGVGIAGMRERIKQLNGSFEVLSTPGRGTLVRAILPVLQPVAQPGVQPVVQPVVQRVVQPVVRQKRSPSLPAKGSN